MAGEPPVCGCGGDALPVGSSRKMKRPGPTKFSAGMRFKPNDCELIRSYLIPRLANQPMPFNVIQEVKIYDYAPEDLVASYRIWGNGRWYFFTTRDRKYPKGDRPNRTAGNGYWKATGSDIRIDYEGNQIGKRKALVFYIGKTGKKSGGSPIATDWIMYEYTVNDQDKKLNKPDGTMKLGDVVLCSIQKKRGAEPPAKSNKPPKAPPRPRDDQNMNASIQKKRGAEPPAKSNKPPKAPPRPRDDQNMNASIQKKRGPKPPAKSNKLPKAPPSPRDDRNMNALTSTMPSGDNQSLVPLQVTEGSISPYNGSGQHDLNALLATMASEKSLFMTNACHTTNQGFQCNPSNGMNFSAEDTFRQEILPFDAYDLTDVCLQMPMLEELSVTTSQDFNLADDHLDGLPSLDGLAIPTNLILQHNFDADLMDDILSADGSPNF